MCTRFYIDKEDPILIPIIQAAERAPIYDAFMRRLGRALITSGEVRPTDIAPVLAPNKNGECTVYPMRWGIHMADGTPLFNARSETAGVKPFFKDDWMRHRCIVPASYYFEWSRKEAAKRDRTEDLTIGSNPVLRAALEKKADPGKYMIQPAGSTVTWLCGLYRIEDGLPYFVVLTREPSDDLRRIHDRMPVILPQDKINEWISPAADPSKTISYALTDMMFERSV